MKEYSSLTETQVHAARNITWPTTDPTFADQAAADRFTDKLIKASTVGSYIHESLTEDAKDQLKADNDKFVVWPRSATNLSSPMTFNL